MADNKVNSGLLEFSEDQKVFVALDAETSEVKKAVTIDEDGVETDIQGVQPSGKKEITSTAEVNVANYATAQVVDNDLIAGNIKKDVDILGVVGSYEGGPAVTIEALSVTENGTYSEEGKAYSPVTVNVEGDELSNDLQTVTIPALTLTGEYSEDIGAYMTATKVADAVTGVDPVIDYNAELAYSWFVRNNEGKITPANYKTIDGVDIMIEVNNGEIFLDTIGPTAYTVQVPSDTLIFYIANADLIGLYGDNAFCNAK